MASGSVNRRINIWINGKEVKNDIKSITKEFHRQRNGIKNVTRGTEEYRRKMAELKRTKKILDDHNKSIRGTRSAWTGMGNLIKTALGPLLALTGIISGIRSLVRGNSELSESFADVQKTTNLTSKGMEDLNNRLKSIDTRTSQKRLLELARDAGKLGITGVKNIEGFVKAADQIDVSLGEDLGEDAIKSLGKLNNIFGTSDVFGYEQGLLKLGSTVNELGANSEASEGQIVDFANRLAGVATQADISFQNIAGLGALLDSLGQKTEMSSTAIQQALVGMFKDTDTYAEIAGKTVAEFTDLLNTDANEAFIQVMEGLQGNNDGLTELAARFDKLGIDGTRAIQVLGAVAGNTDKLRQQQQLANKAFEEGSSLTEEFSKKNNNLAGNLAKIGKAFRDAWVNGGVKGAIDGIVASMADFVEVPISESLKEQQSRFNSLMFTLRDVNTTEEHRAKIIKELQESYGDRLGNLDLEKAGYEELEKAQRSANKQYLVEITLQKQKEKIQELNEKAADQLDEQWKRREAANLALFKANQRLGTSYQSVEEAVRALSKTAKSSQGIQGGMIAQNEEARVLKEISTHLGWAKIAGENYAETQGEIADETDRGNRQMEWMKEQMPELAGLIDGVMGNAADKTGKAADELERLNKATGGGAQRQQIEMETFDPLSAPEIQQAQTIQDMQEEIMKEGAERMNEIHRLRLKKEAEDEEAALQVLKEQRREFSQDIANIGFDIANTVFQRQEQNQLRQLDRQEENFMESLETQREKGLLSDQALNDKRAEAYDRFEAKKLAIQKSAFQKKKGVDIAQALINGALAITKVQAQTGVLSPFAIPLIVAQTAAQVGTIASQKFKDGGQIKGPSHTDGGMPVINPRTGQIEAELEGDEFITRKSSVNATTLPILRAINEGKVPQVNFSGFQQETRRKYAEGDVFEPKAKPQPSAAPPQNGPAIDLTRLENDISGLRADMNTWQSTLRVVLSDKEHNEFKERKEKVKRIASVT